MPHQRRLLRNTKSVNKRTPHLDKAKLLMCYLFVTSMYNFAASMPSKPRPKVVISEINSHDPDNQVTSGHI